MRILIAATVAAGTVAVASAANSQDFNAAGCAELFDGMQKENSFMFDGDFQTGAAIESVVSKTPPVLKNVATGQGYPVSSEEYDYLTRQQKFWVTYLMAPDGANFIRGSLSTFAGNCSKGPSKEVSFDAVPFNVVVAFLVTVQNAADYGEGDRANYATQYKSLGRKGAVDRLRKFVESGSD